MKKTIIALMLLSTLSYGAELVVDMKMDGNLNDSKENLSYANKDTMTWVNTDTGHVTGSLGYLSVQDRKAAWNASFVTAPSSSFALTFFVNVGEYPTYVATGNSEESWASTWIVGGGSSDTANNLKIGIGTEGQLKMSLVNVSTVTSGDTKLALDTWYQVGISSTASATANKYDYTIYINGEAISTMTGQNAVNWSRLPMFEGSDCCGNDKVASTKRFTGYVDEFQIYNVTDLADAQAVMTAQAARLVPEPTTATLSLLALCGLAARRRRK